MSETILMIRREARLSGAPSTLNAERGTVEATITTGARVARSAPAPDGSYTRWWEELDMVSMRLSPPDGVPLLLDHEQTFDSLVGRVSGLRREGGGLVATLTFANGPRPREAMQRVADGALTGVSVGYHVGVWTQRGEQDGRPVYVGSQIEIAEVSLVPIPADAAARVRSAQPNKETPMPDMNMPDDPAELATRAERTRVATIRDIGAIALRQNVLPPDTLGDLERAAITAGATPDAFRADLMERVLAQPQTPAPAPRPVNFGESYDAPHAIRSRMVDALAARVTGRDPGEAARQYRGLSLAGMASELMAASGSRMSRAASPNEIMTRAMTTSDFPLLLQGTMYRLLQDRLAAAPGAARMICAARTVRDFRPGQFVQAAGARDLHELGEGGEIQHAPPAERGESYQLQTWARMMFFTRQALVNDDLGAFEQTMLLANAVTATEAQEFAKMFATNGAGWGPTLTDGQPLFSAAHGNVGTGACSTAGISAGRIVMRAQTDASGNLIAPEPRMMLVSPTNETAAEQALNAIAVVATGESDRPVFASRLTHAVEPRLSGAPWFLFADPAMAPVLAFVTGENTGGVPQITEHVPANRDGISFKLVHDFTIAPMSFVGAVRMTGAG
ncbi:phage major capsid protein [Roseococcus suduntuyensis]|uniref:HK97 family phage prohead protease n=1 Tax=Roseococcus suduntuyensis TaxID=455361 RepID=A0A840AFU0_9PROT|nr:HK97 family phage prohead protease [Roseococcus suduntuyensis]MBB3899971.1 HK97 family phage prohead protease [Roseococcus suduntuyensis]